MGLAKILNAQAALEECRAEQFKCLECGTEFGYDKPPGPVDCPCCGHTYVKCLNYEKGDT